MFLFLNDQPKYKTLICSFRIFTRLFISCALFFCDCAQSWADTHTVTLGNFFYSPQDLTINEGDTVRWVWDTSGHDVAEGDLNTPNSERAFLSSETLSDAGFIYSVNFNRALINSNMRSGNRYDYVCTPHAGFMFGSVTVVRQPKLLRAVATSWQVVSPSGSNASGDISLTLSANEDSIALSGTHNVQNALSIALRSGVVGTSGSAFCVIAGTSPVSGTCSGINSTIADSLFSGDVYLEVRSQQFPNGEIRGQVYQDNAGPFTVSGRVLDQSSTPVAGVTVSDDTRIGTTSNSGFYSLTGISNGVYKLSGSLSDHIVLPASGVSPYLVNGFDLQNKNLTVFSQAPPTITPTPSSSICIGGAGSGLEVLSPIDGSLLESFDLSVAISLLAAGSAQAEISLNGESTKGIPPFSLLAHQGLNSLSVWALDFSGNRLCPVSEKLFTVNSALTNENIDAASKVVLKAVNAKSIRGRRRALRDVLAILEQMKLGGARNPDAPALTHRAISRAQALTKTAINKIRSTRASRRVQRYLRRLVGS